MHEWMVPVGYLGLVRFAFVAALRVTRNDQVTLLGLSGLLILLLTIHGVALLSVMD
jgi:hypothetical protein